jgi:xylan 1,4-beta-xylosidase
MFAGFRSLATGGIDKPVLNTFRMMSKMSGDRVAAHSDHAVPLDQIIRRGVRRDADVSALASLDGNKLSVLVWHYHDEDVAGDDAVVTLNLAGLPEGSRDAKVLHFRIDETHSNAYAAWQKMGSPKELTAEQYEELDKIDGLQMLNNGEVLHMDGGQATLSFALPRKAVSLLVVEW